MVNIKLNVWGRKKAEEGTEGRTRERRGAETKGSKGGRRNIKKGKE